MNDIKVCKYCGNLEHEGAVKCSKCGGYIGDYGEPVRNQPRQQNQNVVMQQAPVHNQRPVDINRQPNRQNKIDSNDVKVCKYCGNLEQEGAAKCSRCGKYIGDYGQPISSQPQRQPKNQSPVRNQPAVSQQIQDDKNSQLKHQPNNTAPNNTAPNNTAPNNTAPNNTAPNNTAPNNTAPNNTVPNRVYVQMSMAPIRQLKTNRGAVKAIILTIVTLGIYSIVLFTKMADELNITASRYDGKKTMNYCLLFFIVGPLTFEIATLVWFCKFSGRIGNELRRRNIDYSFGASDFWLWNVLGSLIIIGPFVYLHKMIKAINLINENYNVYG